MTPPRRPPGNAFATVDFDRPGRQAGFVMFPHSPHDDAWGVTRLPIGIIANLDDPRTATATACRAGMTTVGTEMRGGETVSLDAVDIIRRGVRNVMAHLGVIAPTGPAPQDAGDILDLPAPAAYVYATDDGVFEPFHELGTRVSAGQPAGRTHRPWDTAFAPVTLLYGLDGSVFGRRHLGRVAPGNCVLVVAAPARGLPAQLAGNTA